MDYYREKLSQGGDPKAQQCGWLKDITMLVNNAGVGSVAQLLNADVEKMDDLPYQNLPASIVMSPEDVIDAALVGLDQGEQVTLPSLHDEDEWTRFEAARRAISRRFGNAVPAPRYGPGAPAHHES